MTAFRSIFFNVVVLFRSFFRARIMRAWCFSDLLALANSLTHSMGRWIMLWPSLLFSDGSVASSGVSRCSRCTPDCNLLYCSNGSLCNPPFVKAGGIFKGGS